MPIASIFQRAPPLRLTGLAILALVAISALSRTALAEADLPSLDLIEARRALFVVGYDTVPKHVIDAVIAAEDPGYWKLRLNPLGSHVDHYTAQLLLTDLDGRGARRSPLRRLGFAALFKVNHSRQQRLEVLLNLAYFGRGAIGLESAAQVHLGKTVSELNLADGAFLAALLKAPSHYLRPDREDDLRRRRDFVLGEMARSGWIGEAERLTASAEPLPN